ncbi:MAG: hypothetical protein M3020_17430 [Myxococcota bacterium]|jgi:hypothetical protein|nr:hypothetical protein [Myxococcota bacterium]
MSRRHALLGLLAVLTLGLSTRPGAGEPAEQELAVVVAKTSPIEELSFFELRRLYLGEDLRGPGGKKLIPLNRDSKSPERVGFDRSVLGLSPEAAARYWIDRRIRGQSGPPKVVEPATVLQRVVARVPFTVTYVRRGEVSAELKIIRIDGKRPGDSGYPIVIGASAPAPGDQGSSSGVSAGAPPALPASL